MLEKIIGATAGNRNRREFLVGSVRLVAGVASTVIVPGCQTVGNDMVKSEQELVIDAVIKYLEGTTDVELPPGHPKITSGWQSMLSSDDSGLQTVPRSITGPHTGVDIVAPIGTIVLAPIDGNAYAHRAPSGSLSVYIFPFEPVFIYREGHRPIFLKAFIENAHLDSAKIPISRDDDRQYVPVVRGQAVGTVGKGGARYQHLHHGVYVRDEDPTSPRKDAKFVPVNPGFFWALDSNGKPECYTAGTNYSTKKEIIVSNVGRVTMPALTLPLACNK